MLNHSQTTISSTYHGFLSYNSSTNPLQAPRSQPFFTFIMIEIYVWLIDWLIDMDGLIDCHLVFPADSDVPTGVLDPEPSSLGLAEDPSGVYVNYTIASYDPSWSPTPSCPSLPQSTAKPTRIQCSRLHYRLYSLKTTIFSIS